MLRAVIICCFWLSVDVFGAYFGLYTHERRYVSPQNERDFEQVLKLDVWEKFQFIHPYVNDYGDDLGANVGYLRSQKGVYIGADREGVNQVVDPGPWELFERMYLADGKVAFRNLAFNNYLSFEGKLRMRPHLKHWESFQLHWVGQNYNPSTEVYLIKGRIPYTPALHGGLLFREKSLFKDNWHEYQAHFAYKNTMWGGDGEIWDDMELEGEVHEKLGDLPFAIHEALEWTYDWVKTKKYRGM